jgi:5-methylcytosine-specific restriction endonuclease McrA
VVTVFLLKCANCCEERDMDKRPRSPFCSPKCKDIAKYVRYGRSLNGRDITEDEDYALRIKFSMILGGGYDVGARRIPENIRSEVVRRAKCACQKCGKPGSEIDHIRGSSHDLSNLQLLCVGCHREKTELGMRRLTGKEVIEADTLYWSLQERIISDHPLQECDDELRWADEWRSYLSMNVTAV